MREIVNIEKQVRFNLKHACKESFLGGTEALFILILREMVKGLVYQIQDRPQERTTSISYHEGDFIIFRIMIPMYKDTIKELK